MSGHSGLPLSSTSEILVTRDSLHITTYQKYSDWLYAFSEELETQTSNFAFDFVEEGELSDGKYKSNREMGRICLM